MITASGVGSGMDIEGIVTQLMQLEQQPLQVMQQRRNNLSVKVSDFGKLKSALSELDTSVAKLSDSSAFGSFQATSNDEDVLTLGKFEGTRPENHDITISSLAAPNRLMSTAYASAEDTIGVGDYTFGSADNSFTITLDSGADSVIDFVGAINDAADNNSVHATLINAADGTRVVLSARESGLSNAISAPADFTQTTAASDATLTVDGLSVIDSSNTLTNVIPGLSIELKSIGTANIQSEQDIAGVEEVLTEFTESYNQLRTTTTQLALGSLQGDAITRRVESVLRNEFFGDIDIGDGENYSVLNFGLSFDKTGVLSVDSSELTEAMASHPGKLLKVFSAAETGFAAKMQNTITSFTETGGNIDLRTETLDIQDDAIETQMSRFSERLEIIEARYRRQFGAMDSMIARLQSSGDFLISQLSSSNQSNN